tara:strand:+ start:4018 stop:4140 length:123 start_codon:yes stop_codon:yes gene_type:complete
MNILALAERLNLTIAEIEQISVSEMNEWLAYYRILSEENG